MSAKPFLDTNIILYLLSADIAKANRAEALLAKGGMISVQVLNEAASVMTRKLKMGLDETNEILVGIRRFCTVEPLTLAVHERALLIVRRYGFSVYDGLIVASALAAECNVLYSEDLQNGQQIEAELTIVDPFQ